MSGRNRLYFGDNLRILREYVPDASVDLIYLDPPFNSSATYNVLFKEKSGEGIRRARGGVNCHLNITDGFFTVRPWQACS